jgi:two-component system, chemotaxis family, sensor kinase CheA
MDETEIVIKEFVAESKEGLDQFDRDLVELEKDPKSRQLLDKVFRAIHSVKGSAGVLGFPKLVGVSHAGENLLGMLRDGDLVLTPAQTTTLLAMSDAIRRTLNSIAEFNNEGEADHSSIVEQLTALAGANKSNSGAALPSPASLAIASPSANHLFGEILVESGKTSKEAVLSALDQQNEGDPRLVGEILITQNKLDPGAIAGALQTQAERRSDSSDNIRVDVALLDKVMNLVGELVLARNQIVQFAGDQTDMVFLNAAQRLKLITTELQEGVMKTRMQPIGTVWSKFPRLIRDMALSCGKSVKIEVEGADTELDKTLIEAIKDPLTHIVRNAVDHGIEAPEVRKARGKPAQGKLRMRASHEGGQVNIEISDDGEGVRIESVKQKAIAKGLITTAQAAHMSEREILYLIFEPGLSTAEKITNISGRGVGMDVVKTNIEKIGGTIDIQSVPGQGTRLKLKIPLTLAIIPALIVTSSGQRFAIPQLSLVELVRADRENSGHAVEFIHGAPVYRLRGNLLPLVYLNRELKLRTGGEEPTEANIVVLQAGEKQFGLVVDEINDTEEIVVKPLSKHLKALSCFAGATIMGDGKAALIIDVFGIAQRANVVSETLERASVKEAVTKSSTFSDKQDSWLLFRVGATGRMAIPLSLVSRLEEFPADTLERSTRSEVVQYRGQIMPIKRVCNLVGTATGSTPDTMQVIVYSDNGKNIGLAVEEILDIVEQNICLERQDETPGVLGTAVIGRHVTDILDIDALLGGNFAANERVQG